MAASEQESSYKLPPTEIWNHISKLAIVDDKPIMLDYWTDSLEKKVLIGVKKDSGEKLLVKNSEEYTSPISKIYKTNNETKEFIQLENKFILSQPNIPVVATGGFLDSIISFILFLFKLYTAIINIHKHRYC